MLLKLANTLRTISIFCMSVKIPPFLVTILPRYLSSSTGSISVSSTLIFAGSLVFIVRALIVFLFILGPIFLDSATRSFANFEINIGSNEDIAGERRFELFDSNPLINQ